VSGGCFGQEWRKKHGIEVVKRSGDYLFGVLYTLFVHFESISLGYAIIVDDRKKQSIHTVLVKQNESGPTCERRSANCEPTVGKKRQR